VRLFSEVKALWALRLGFTDKSAIAIATSGFINEINSFRPGVGGDGMEAILGLRYRVR
jgi:hypothetical protein